MIKNQKMLFVCGAPRSGTTAMHALLTADKRIVMGMERYEGYLNDELGPQLFSKERFFNFESDPRDSKKSLPYYADIAAPCFETSEYIGDKIPLLYQQFGRVIKAFPEAKFVVLLRNIIDICNSYQNLQDDPNHDWSFDVHDAVNHWNQLLEFIKLHGSDPRIKLVVYEDFYTLGIERYKDLYAFLNLELDDVLVQGYRKTLEITQHLEQKRKTVLHDVQKIAIYKKANFELYQSILNKGIASSNPTATEMKTVTNDKNSIALGEADIASAFRIFMGRTHVSKTELDGFASLDGIDLMARIFSSSEFQSNAFNRELITSLAAKIRDQLAKTKPS